MIIRVIVLPYLHAPKHNLKALKTVFKYIKHYKPHYLIQLGDWCNYDSLSKYDVLKTKELIGLQAEEKSANEVLDDLEDNLPFGCKKIMCEGNHDRRPETYNLNNWTKEAKKITGKSYLKLFHEAYNLKKRGWQWVEEGQCYKLGKCLFTHGWYVNQFHAAKTVKKWFRTIIYGHSHQYQVHAINGMDGLPVAGISIGTLSRFDLSYMGGVPVDWCNMFMRLEFWGKGFFTPHPITVINGQFSDLGSVWG